MNFESIKRWYVLGIWSDFQVKMAREEGVISQEEYEEILKSAEKRQ